MPFLKLILPVCCICGLVIRCAGADFFPSITTAEWEESYYTNLEYGGEIFSKSENLRGANNATPIIYEFNGNTFIKTKNLLVDDYFPGLPRVDSYTDYELTDEGLYWWGNKGNTYKTVFGKITDSVIYSVESVDWGKTLAGITDRKVRQLPRTGRIGEVFGYEYVSENVSILSATAIEIILGPGYSGESRQTQTTTTHARVRSVFAGYDQVDGLYPGSYPVFVTPSYKALVQIVETYSWGSITTETIGGQFEGTVTNEIDPMYVTTINWLVDGIGGIRTVLVFGPYLDTLLNAPKFDKGDGVVAAQDLITLVGGFIDQEVLRSGGGNLLLAKDAVPTSERFQLFGGVPTPPPPSFTGFWDPANEVRDNWFWYEPLDAVIHIPRETQERPYQGWVWYAPLGWISVKPKPDGSIHLYDPDHGWFWTSAVAHPYFRGFSQGQWYSESELQSL